MSLNWNITDKCQWNRKWSISREVTVSLNWNVPSKCLSETNDQAILMSLSWNITDKCHLETEIKPGKFLTKKTG